jgi:hypothetical protein
MSDKRLHIHERTSNPTLQRKEEAERKKIKKKKRNLRCPIRKRQKASRKTRRCQRAEAIWIPPSSPAKPKKQTNKPEYNTGCGQELKAVSMSSNNVRIRLLLVQEKKLEAICFLKNTTSV